MKILEFLNRKREATQGMGMSRSGAVLVLGMLAGCYKLQYETDWLTYANAREMNASDANTARIHAILKTDETVIDLNRGGYRNPSFTEEGVSYQAPDGATLTLERDLIKGVRIGVYRWSACCPFIYVEEGGTWRRVGEPLGGAISKGLARWETVLLRGGKGPLRVKIANPKGEIQYIDCVQVLAVKTPGLALPKMLDGVAVIDGIRAPRRAIANGSAEVLRAISSPGKASWAGYYEGGDTRDELRFEFDEAPPRPALVVTAGATWLEASFLADLLKKRGDTLQAWYREIDTNPAQSVALLAWAIREEIPILRVEALASDGSWSPAGLILSGGPEVLPRRVFPLKLSPATATPLTLRVRPPKGMWVFDEIGIASMDEAPPASRELKPLSDVPGELASPDGKYFQMDPDAPPVIIEYPPLADSETAFLRIRGYYKILIEPEGDPETVRKIEMIPGEAVRHAHGNLR